MYVIGFNIFEEEREIWTFCLGIRQQSAPEMMKWWQGYNLEHGHTWLSSDHLSLLRLLKVTLGLRLKSFIFIKLNFTPIYTEVDTALEVGPTILLPCWKLLLGDKSEENTSSPVWPTTGAATAAHPPQCFWSGFENSLPMAETSERF